jgi:hypothetical protein
MERGKLMKKFIFILFFAFSILSLSFGVDFGGFIENYSLITNNDDSREQIDKLALWLAFSPVEKIYIAGQACIAYSYNDYDILADVDYLYMTHELSFLSYQVGRFSQYEFSRKVFDHRLDGAQAAASFSNINLKFGAGYTGLLLKPVSTLNNTMADMVDDNDDDIHFAPKKIILNLGATYLDIIPSQQLDFSFVAQFDMRSKDLIKDKDSADKDGKGGKLNTFYFGLGLSGALTGSFIYDVFGYLQVGSSLSLIEEKNEYLDKPTIAFLGGGSLSYLMKDFYFSKITASFIYASGDDDNTSVYQGNTKGNNTQFMPVSEAVTGIIFSPNLSNLIKAGLEYSLKPFSSGIMKDFQAAVSAAVYFKASEGAVSEAIASADSSDTYLGTEAMITLSYRPFSDLGVKLAGGAFFPNSSSSGPMIDTDVEPGLMIHASFSF